MYCFKCEFDVLLLLALERHASFKVVDIFTFCSFAEQIELDK